MRILPAFLLTAVTLSISCAAPATSVPTDLRCEYQISPLAVPSQTPRLSWILRAVDPQQRGAKQTALRILVASSEGALARDRGDLWDSERVTAPLAPFVRYAGKPLPAGEEVYWKVRIEDEAGRPSPWSAPAHWRVAPGEWTAKWIAGQPDGETPAERMPLFRHEFRIDKPVRTALLYISGLGQYEARLNGTALDRDLLQPGWTNYRRTVLYNTFDVTSLLRTGDNAIGVLLGNGMFHVVRPPGRFSKFVGSFGQPKLTAQLVVTYADGTRTQIATDTSWKTRPGPVVFSSTYGGEDYDARLNPAGWDRPGQPAEGWTNALGVSGPGGVLQPEMDPPIRVTQTIRPVKVSEPRPGVFLYDLGQNFSGWPRITVEGAAGTSVRMLPGELLDASGLVTQRSQGGSDRRGHAWMTYTLGGSGAETWRPKFFYYGFRYVQVQGTAKVTALVGEFVHSSAEPAGDFQASTPLLNSIHGLIRQAVRSNMQSVLTDCPHREKLGWLEQSHLAGSAVMYNYDVRGLYEKIQRDMWDGQLENGLVPDIQPEYVIFERGFRDSPEWGSAAVQNPWIFYQHAGDPALIESGYGRMARYVRYLESKSKDGIVSHGLGDWYDVGPGELGESQLTSLGLTATASYYADILTLARVAPLAGHPGDVPLWTRLAENVRESFLKTFYQPATGVLDRGSQTAYAMPLAVGLIPEAQRAAVLKRLVETIQANGYRVTAGDVGFHYVVRALMDGGSSDVFYRMVTQTDGPSYGMQLAKGATSLTEAWDADPTKSQNHFMLGHAEEWFYRALAGLDVDFSRPAGEQIRIAPQPVGDVRAAQASYRPWCGGISVDWKKEGGTLALNVSIPPGMEAMVEISTAGAVQESGKDATQAPGVVAVRRTATSAVYRVASGNYRFRAPGTVD